MIAAILTGRVYNMTAVPIAIALCIGPSAAAATEPSRLMGQAKPWPYPIEAYDVPDAIRSGWHIDTTRSATLDTPGIVARAVCGAGPTVRWVRLRFPLRRVSALRNKTTRVSLEWSSNRSGWSEQEIELRVNGQRRHVTVPRTRPTSAASLQLDVPAGSVRSADELDITILVAARCLGPNAAGTARADALTIEVLP